MLIFSVSFQFSRMSQLRCPDDTDRDGSCGTSGTVVEALFQTAVYSPLSAADAVVVLDVVGGLYPIGLKGPDRPAVPVLTAAETFP